MNNDAWVDIILVAAGPMRHRKLRSLVTEVIGAVHVAGADDGICSARAAVSREIYEALDRGEECRPLLRALERLGHLSPEAPPSTVDGEMTVEIARPAPLGTH